MLYPVSPLRKESVVPAKAVNIHEVDDGYSVALHMLEALRDAEPDGLKADELGELLNTSGSRVGAWLRDLRCRDWTEKVPVTPSSHVVRWHITSAGEAELDKQAD